MEGAEHERGSAPHDGATQGDACDVALEARRIVAALEAGGAGDAAHAEQVEPAVFGALLERALDPRERHALGAHFTPRALVERLIAPALEEPLEAAWSVALAEAEARAGRGDVAGARRAVRGFHARLAGVRVLDPACGTGNFLYVALDRLRAIEARVIARLRELGDARPHPRVGAGQLLGIDRSARASAIARLVIRIGDLQGRARAGDARADPQGEAAIEVGDALAGAWPEADYVIGNPPFLGQQRLRAVLGDAYVDALRAAHPEVPETCDLVMYFWHRAAELLRSRKIERFGFITTNSVTQPMNRAVVARHLRAEPALSLAFAIADHPWVDGDDGAAVRVAMTVARRGRGEGRLCAAGRGLAMESRWGRIHADLTLGADVGACAPLRAMEGLAWKGLELGSQGFVVDRAIGDAWLAEDPALLRVLRPYLNGNDLKRGRSTRYVIDFHGLDEGEARRFDRAYRWVAERVARDRAAGRDARLLRDFWLFRRSGDRLRAAVAGLRRFIGTTRTASHRVFQFLPAGVAAESKIVVIASEDALALGVLSARAHRVFAERIGGRLGKGNDPTYNHASCFAAFPFPACDAGSARRIRALAEALDAARKRAQAADPRLSITAMYAAVEALRAGRSSGARGRIARALAAIHAALDEAVLAAYGLPAGADDESVLDALVSLNAERAREEAQGIVRRLCPVHEASLAAPSPLPHGRGPKASRAP